MTRHDPLNAQVLSNIMSYRGLLLRTFQHDLSELLFHIFAGQICLALIDLQTLNSGQVLHA